MKPTTDSPTTGRRQIARRWVRTGPGRAWANTVRFLPRSRRLRGVDLVARICRAVRQRGARRRLHWQSDNEIRPAGPRSFFPPCAAGQRLLEAESAVADNAVPGDTRWFSPVCSCFDQFRDDQPGGDVYLPLDPAGNFRTVTAGFGLAGIGARGGAPTGRMNFDKQTTTNKHNARIAPII